MSESEFERMLHEAFDAQARASVGDHVSPPPPRFAQVPSETHRSRGRLVRWAAPLTAAAAVIGVVAAVAGLSHDSSGDRQQAAGSPSVRPSTATSPSTVQSAAPRSTAFAPVAPDPNAVHVKLLNDDGATYGVGMPVIAYFSQKITSGVTLQQATKATVNGKPVTGAWYFEKSDAGNGPIEAHFRLATYWTADADVRVELPIKGLSAGGALTYDDSLTTEFHTGPANIATVDQATHLMTVTADGKDAGTYPVSLGIKNSPTRDGVKVIMNKQTTVTLPKPVAGHSTLAYAQRLTYLGEYLCAAPWAQKSIDTKTDSSRGSTYLSTADAKTIFERFHIGDVVVFKNAPGTPMHLSSGYGDWTVKWKDWLSGGLVHIS